MIKKSALKQIPQSGFTNILTFLVNLFGAAIYKYLHPIGI